MLKALNIRLDKALWALGGRYTGKDAPLGEEKCRELKYSALRRGLVISDFKGVKLRIVSGDEAIVIDAVACDGAYCELVVCDTNPISHDYEIKEKIVCDTKSIAVAVIGNIDNILAHWISRRDDIKRSLESEYADMHEVRGETGVLGEYGLVVVLDKSNWLQISPTADPRHFCRIDSVLDNYHPAYCSSLSDVKTLITKIVWNTSKDNKLAVLRDICVRNGWVTKHVLPRDQHFVYQARVSSPFAQVVFDESMPLAAVSCAVYPEEGGSECYVALMDMPVGDDVVGHSDMLEKTLKQALV